MLFREWKGGREEHRWETHGLVAHMHPDWDEIEPATEVCTFDRIRTWDPSFLGRTLSTEQTVSAPDTF